MPEQAAFRALLRRRVVELRQPHRAHQRRIRLERQLARLFRKRSAGFVNGDAAQQTLVQSQFVAISARDMLQNLFRFAGDFDTNPVAGQKENV